MPTNSMGPADDAQHAIRRSTRLPLEIPLLVTSLDPKTPFSEQCNTTLVNAHGCGLIAPRAIAQDIQVRLDMVSAKRHTTARVREVVPLGGDTPTWLLGLELDVPGNFWGIDYAPSDWKVEEVVCLPAEPPRPEPPADAKPAPWRRWRLTDISAGACYLETAIPLPVASDVLLSFRVAEKEYLLEGIVRVSHPEIGMGVEFTPTLDHDPRVQVEELIGHLKSSREVPKIFAGRKEAGSKQKRGHPQDAPRPANPPADAASSDDPLLQLIRQAPSLTAEQFLNDLRAQRLGKRRDPRVDLALQVLLTGTDVNGRPLNQRVVTINISRRGALLDGVHGMLTAGDKLSLSRQHHTEQFQVAWVGEEGTPAAGQIGVAALDPNTTFWSDVLETMVQSRIGTAQSDTAGVRDRGNDP